MDRESRPWRYTGADRICDERRAQRPVFEEEDFDLDKDRIVSDLLELGAMFSAKHHNKNVIDRAVAVLCARNRVSIPRYARGVVSERQGKLCTYCGSTEGPFHVDHIFPVARGGSDHPSNLTLACGRCNLAKGDKTLAEWLGRNEPLCKNSNE